jgi:tRNA G10  N-methylase Trm11
MSDYFFLFGNTPTLSLLELQSLVEDVTVISPDLARVSLTSDEEAQAIFSKTGGTVKLVKEIGPLADTEDDTVILMAAYLNEQKSDSKLTFGLALLGQDTLAISETQLKKALKQEYKLSSRFIEHSKTGLSASVLLHQENVIEVALIGTQEGNYLGETIAIQDIDDWTKRDRKKPYSDRKKGMLPPKVARMMVNIAVGNTPSTVYDPFCGTGTVLSEALMVGHDVIGSDLDGKATAGAEKNLEWLKQEYDLTGDWKVFFSDASQVHKMSDLSNNLVDAIVTEPFLGKPKPELKQLENIYKGLEKMYLGAFKAFKAVLKDQGKIVIVFPMVEAPKKVYDLSNLIDKLAQLGYTTTSEPIVYARKNAVVQRQIFVFTVNK